MSDFNLFLCEKCNPTWKKSPPLSQQLPPKVEVLSSHPRPNFLKIWLEVQSPTPTPSIKGKEVGGAHYKNDLLFNSEDIADKIILQLDWLTDIPDKLTRIILKGNLWLLFKIFADLLSKIKIFFQIKADKFIAFLFKLKYSQKNTSWDAPKNKKPADLTKSIC